MKTSIRRMYSVVDAMEDMYIPEEMYTFIAKDEFEHALMFNVQSQEPGYIFIWNEDEFSVSCDFYPQPEISFPYTFECSERDLNIYHAIMYEYEEMDQIPMRLVSSKTTMDDIPRLWFIDRKLGAVRNGSEKRIRHILQTNKHVWDYVYDNKKCIAHFDSMWKRFFCTDEKLKVLVDRGHTSHRIPILKKLEKVYADECTISIHRFDISEKMKRTLLDGGVSGFEFWRFWKDFSCYDGCYHNGSTSRKIKEGNPINGRRVIKSYQSIDYRNDSLFDIAKDYGIKIPDLLFLMKNTMIRGQHDIDFIRTHFGSNKQYANVLRGLLKRGHFSLQNLSEMKWDLLDELTINWINTRVKEISPNVLNIVISGLGMDMIHNNPSISMSNLLTDMKVYQWKQLESLNLSDRDIMALVEAKYDIEDFNDDVRPYLHMTPSAEKWIDGSIEEGEWKIEVCPRQDFSTLFLGVATNCCQHPIGAGSTSAWHGYLADNGGFVKVSKKGEIVAQSWIWKSKNVLMFDNIESLMPNHPKLLEMYTKFAEMQLSDFQKVCCGKGYSGVNLNNLPVFKGELKFPKILGGNCYTDAREAVIIAERK